ncbi:class I adenylate-forming enzyme family protein [Acrocarpospora catenulata]|uniref:class I adenylate-forming enzyme family protein n=1 Tax=Acrocarpospora catenulata TaxID=2836182 RepID=UPI001BDABBCF|nr:fatty acid--CoA ligase family protein [Acrocarpospora catenulata]
MALSATPDRVAISSPAATLTVRQFADRVDAVAQAIVEAGAGTVAYLGVNGPSFPIAIFASARAGVPVSPLNYRLGQAQLNAALDRLDRPLIIVDEALRDMVVARSSPLLATADLLTRPAKPDQDAPGWPEESAPAVLLFTSGTTSTPKTVVLRHSHLMSYVVQTVEFGSAEESDAALISVPPYHIAGVGTVLTSLYAGRRMVYLEDFSAEGWLRAARENAVTTAMLVPTMLARIVEALAGRPADLPRLRSIAYGGARMPAPVLLKALRAFPTTGFANAYGLTETSSTIAVLGPEDHREAAASDDPEVSRRLASAGRLVPGVEAEIRDPDGNPLPPGEVGELWVRGPQVSGEYLGQGSVLVDGWFPTRDRAWLDPAGFLYIEGRADDTIIRGGENIAPAEIEAVLVEHANVRDVAVVGMPDDTWGQRLIAVVVPADGAEISEEELRSWVKTRLRSSKTPDQVHVWTELPYTPTGKLLRRDIVLALASAD